MDNAHNPIAVRVENIQKIWNKTRKDKPKAQIFSMVCSTEDFPLLDGFIRLESSVYGKSDDSFVAFMIDFYDKKSFYATIIEQWILTFEEDLKKNPGWKWEDFEVFKQILPEIDKLSIENLKDFYIKMLVSFKKFEAKTGNLLIVSFLIKKATDSDLLIESIKELTVLLPENIGFLFLDYKERKLYTKLIDFVKQKGIIIEIPNQEINKAYKEIASQGNPNDPQVRYRKCLFEIGEAAKDKKQEKVKKLGNELIDISKSTGETSFWASSYLVYASFLFQFKDEQELIHQLLDKGIKITTPFYKDKQDIAGILMQLLMYKGSHYSLIGQRDSAIHYFLKQTVIAKELQQEMQAINGYNYALLLAARKRDGQYTEILNDAFEYGYALTDEALKVINFTFIANSYLENESKIGYSEKEAISNRMVLIFGENWKDNPKQIAKQIQEEYQLNNT
ncbi:hypothetical protein Q1W71_22950 [Flavobacterium pectinovorum]|uniref:hypothetical protein n=1 Tax=Flavobacterium pectinovorum TaxID=29533 RepID=UPI00265E49A1|nr:hypothetical protein [Flavobacterium pectinovorum]WKL47793.1 hypothetical protein Q1W71_22950 [Flavobacterium pectinovorum]